jgi:hypothetical protein
MNGVEGLLKVAQDLIKQTESNLQTDKEKIEFAKALQNSNVLAELNKAAETINKYNGNNDK